SSGSVPVSHYPRPRLSGTDRRGLHGQIQIRRPPFGPFPQGRSEPHDLLLPADSQQNSSLCQADLTVAGAESATSCSKRRGGCAGGLNCTQRETYSPTCTKLLVTTFRT